MSGNLPPGCGLLPGEEPGADDCSICHHDVDECICPECPTCGSVGDPGCYGGAPQHHRGKHRRQPAHGLMLTKAQIIARRKREIAHALESIGEQQQDVQRLEDGEFDGNAEFWASETAHATSQMLTSMGRRR